MIILFTIKTVTMISERCINLIQASNIMALLSGFITTMVGVSLIPQNINNGSVYLGSAEEYQADLQALQYSSYGFKVSIAGTIIFGYGLLGCISVSIYNNVEHRRNTVLPIEAPSIRLSIPPSIQPSASSIDAIRPIKSILKPTPLYEMTDNTRKWTGHVKLDIV